MRNMHKKDYRPDAFKMPARLSKSNGEPQKLFWIHDHYIMRNSSFSTHIPATEISVD